MRAALYLRVSTDEQASSLDAQESGARAWCERTGHAVVHVYRDEGVSGGEWKHRPGVQQLRADAEHRPRPWDLVVVRDLDRLGRDAIRLPELLSHLRDHGLEVWEWSTGSVVALDGMALIVAQLRAGLAQIEREQIAHRTRTALKQRAERGMVTGGSVYGYRNERGPEGVRYEVDPAEAPIVRELFERHADGVSARRLAADLNLRGVPSPRAEGGGTGSWCSGTVRAILRSARYRGDATWGRVGSRYKAGSRVTERRTDVVRYAVPPIVDAALWLRAQSRTTPAREASGRGPARGPEPRYLLIGHGVCDACGGPLASWRSTSGSGPASARRVVPSYRCLWHTARGNAVCAARFCRPAGPIDRAVLGALADSLSPAEVRAALARARALARDGARPDHRAEAEAAERAAAQRVTRLGAALEHGAGDLAELVARLRAATADLEQARAALQALPAPVAQVFDLDTERELVALADDLRGTLATGYDRAESGDREAMKRLRAVLSAALPQPLRVQSDAGGVKVVGSLTPGALLVGTGGMVATPTVIHHTHGWVFPWEFPLSLAV